MVLRISDRCGGRDNNFNLLRMIAAGLVLVSHAYPLALGPQALEPLSQWLTQDHIHDNIGRVAVWAFFGISGFFITRSFSARRSLTDFLRARAWRLLPALLPMALIVFLAVAFWGNPGAPAAMLPALPGYLYQTLTLNLTNMFGMGVIPYVSGTLPGAFADNPFPGAVNGSLWTLPYEVLCYVTVVLAGLAGVLARPRWFALALVALIACYLAIFAGLGPRDGRIDHFLYLAVPFWIGGAFWIWRDKVVLSPLISLALFGLAWLALGSLLFRPLFCLALIHLLFTIGYARLPLLGQYNRLGDYSYGLYVYAFPIQQLAAAHGATSVASNILVALPLTLLLAVLSWHFVERPLMEHGRKPRPRSASSVQGQDI